METTLKGLEFDPGFAPYILAFRGTIEYLYLDINRFKNFSQRKMKFRQYYKKFLELLYNNLGFYIGCLMWAAYIKTQPEQEILNNYCLGETYNEEENTADIDYAIKFMELFSKDMKYFLGEDYNVNPEDLKIAKAYRDFLIINKGFTNSKTNSDILLPEGINAKNPEEFKDIIYEVLNEKNLSRFVDKKDLILQVKDV